MPDASETRVPCSTETRDRLRGKKQGGMTYDELFQQMMEQYDPDAEGRATA